MNWLNIVIAAGYQGSVVQIGGRDFFVVSGATFSIKDPLSRMGFRWNREFPKAWSIDLQFLLRNPQSINQLADLGLSVPEGGAASPRNKRPRTPAPAPQQQNWLTNITWYLARRSSDNQLVALSRGANRAWNWVAEDGSTGTHPEASVAEFARSIRDAEGKPISGLDPEKLFARARNSIDLPSTQTDPKGRIPPDKISEHQKAVETTFLSTQNNIMMSALAGSGKTSMLRHLAAFKNPKEKWLYLVFNKKNQIEGSAKFPRDVEVLTSHSFLGKVLGRSAELGLVPNTEIWNDHGERLPRLLDHMMAHDQTFPYKVRYVAKKIIKQLASLGKAYAINPAQPDADQKIAQIIEQFQIDTDLSTKTVRSDVNYRPQLIEKALDLMHASLPGNSGVPEYENYRDHDDSLWYAAIMPDIKWPKYDVVLADEVQDFNRCQIFMLQKLSEQGARIIAVGDVFQSLYLFRGADAHAFEDISKLVSASANGGAHHDLPVNYRSGKAIIQYINENTTVNNLQAGAQHEGMVTEGQDYDDMLSEITREWQQNRGRLNQQTAIISRTNKPLVGSALNLMQSDVNFVIIGRDFSRELISQVENVIGRGRRQQNVSMPQLAQMLGEFVSDVEQKWIGKISKEPELNQIKDVTESLVSVIDHLEANNYHDERLRMNVKDSATFIEYLRRRFAGIDTNSVEGDKQFKARDPRSFVTLTTAHRSKGLEFDRVLVTDPQLFPHPNAKTPEARQQEDNAWYVALTRAKNELHVLAPPTNKPTGSRARSA